MRVTITSVLYPQKGKESANGFTILSAVCNSHRKEDSLAVDHKGNDLFGKRITIKGNYLPMAKGLQCEIEGKWLTDKRGQYFSPTSVREEVPQNETGIMAYLTSGLIKGIGQATAKAIYKKFGDDTLNVMDNTPDRLLEVSGIKQKKLEKIISSYTAYRGAKDVVALLVPLGIGAKKAVNIYNRFKQESVDIVKNHPFRLCEVSGISFQTADLIAQKQNVNPHDEARLKAGLLEVLKQAENGGQLFSNSSGHLCLGYNEWLAKASALLSGYQSNVGFMELEVVASELSKEKKVVGTRNPNTNELFVYRYATALAEHETAKYMSELIAASQEPGYDIKDNIRQMELDNNFRLAPEQANAVETGLKNNLSIITGGPGTGKTTIINFIRRIYSANNPSATILLCAPTGRAARRMSESTGYQAYTIHKSLGIRPVDDEAETDQSADAEELDYDMIIVDEVSMLDIFLARTFFKAIRKGCQVAFIGDYDQLPSVGPGAVLAEMINCGAIAVARLTRVYRQAGDSKIALNALLMKRGNYEFDYDDTFQFIPAESFEDAAQKMGKIFLKEVATEGIDNVTMLSPFRSDRTATGVFAMNAYIRDSINPPAPNKKEVMAQNRLFRVGDKVMQTRNIDEISNGDIGYITNIFSSGSNAEIQIDFDDDRIVTYDISEMETIIWAYATTVHKSQGSEYKIVIFNILEGHSVMLKRNLLYTAVTRAKQKVYIIGSKRAMIQAVQTGTDDRDKRNTMLGCRIQHMVSQNVMAGCS